jgi:hypothetical protein
VRTYHLVPKRLQLAENWLNTQRVMWEQRMDRFEAYVTTMPDDAERSGGR